MKKLIVTTYSIIHFIVDLACNVLVVNLVASKLGNDVITLFDAVIAYNFFAFAVQLPVGIIADKLNKNAICSAVGCLLVSLGFAFYNNAILAAIIAGIGNSLFHVGGGIDVLNISDKKATPSGIYVSTGALGVFLGSLSGKYGFNKYYIVHILLLLSFIALIYLYTKIKDKVSNVETKYDNISISEVIAIICLMITVCIRSYVGMILNFSWKSNIVLAVIAILSVVFGKMLGGIIGDRIGFKKISVISLLLSGILFIFAFNNPALGIIAILFFNMTMPITLTALSNILNNGKGFAFGLLTFALFVGAMPAFFGDTSVVFNKIGLCIITLASMVILYIGIKLYENYMKKIEN
ncbi:MAG: MFS transporter [Clostridia bacterium]|nr:MFS transporter [Clostridia bacterium]